MADDGFTPFGDVLSDDLNNPNDRDLDDSLEFNANTITANMFDHQSASEALITSSRSTVVMKTEPMSSSDAPSSSNRQLDEAERMPELGHANQGSADAGLKEDADDVARREERDSDEKLGPLLQELVRQLSSSVRHHDPYTSAREKHEKEIKKHSNNKSGIDATFFFPMWRETRAR